MPNSASTLRNGLKILEILKSTSGLRLTEISQQLGLNKTTVFRLLGTLVELNYLKKIDNKYSLVHQTDITNQYNDPYLNWVAIPVSKNITNKFQTTAFIGILRGKDVVITQVFPANQGFDEFKVLGNVTPVNLSALGKGIVAFLPQDEQTNILKQLNFDIATKYTLSDQLTFQQNLKIIAQQGYALDDEESTIGIRCLAVPIFRNQRVIAALGISGTFDKIPRGKLKQMAHELISCSREITNEFF